MCKRKTDKVINVGAEIAGNFASMALADAIMPGVSMLGNVVGPVVKTVIGDIAHRLLSNNENRRLAYVEDCIIRSIKQRLDAGEQPRRDDDFYVEDKYQQSSASKLLEGTLYKCKQEYEGKKLKFYGNFWSNICFANGVNYETADSIISHFSALSYQQIKILVYLNADKIIPLGSWEKYMFNEEILSPYFTFYSDCLHLYNVRLAVQPKNPSGGVQLGTPKICISPFGKLMCNLLELEISESEFAEIASYINFINAIVDRLKNETNISTIPPNVK